MGAGPTSVPNDHDENRTSETGGDDMLSEQVTHTRQPCDSR